MLRYLFTMCDILSSLCALVSPVVIFHWLFKVLNLPPLQGIISSLDPIFLPLESILELFIKLPSLNFGGHAYSTTPGLLAVLLTCAFFFFNFLSETLKVAEQRMNVQVDAQKQRMRMQKMREEQLRKEKSLPDAMKIFVFVDYDVQPCPFLGEKLEQFMQQEGAHVHSRVFNELALEFTTIEQGLRFVLGVSQSILGHYATLRPLDPQPPFKLSLHAVDKTLSISAGVSDSHKLVQFIVNNQVIISQSAKALLDSCGTEIPYRLQSLGVYAMDTGERELFRLFAGKQSTSL